MAVTAMQSSADVKKEFEERRRQFIARNVDGEKKALPRSLDSDPNVFHPMGLDPTQEKEKFFLAVASTLSSSFSECFFVPREEEKSALPISPFHFFRLFFSQCEMNYAAFSSLSLLSSLHLSTPFKAPSFSLSVE